MEAARDRKVRSFRGKNGQDNAEFWAKESNEKSLKAEDTVWPQPATVIHESSPKSDNGEETEFLAAAYRSCHG